MIIFGTRTMPSKRQEGHFHCPRCSAKQPYNRVNVNRWFTLYFIPVIPMGSAGEYIECLSCAGTYKPEVLSYNPDAARQETLDTIRRSLTLFMAAAGRTSMDDVRKLQEAILDVFGEQVSGSAISQDLQHAQRAQVPLGPYIAKQLGGLTPKGKEAVLYAASQVVSIGGHIPSYEAQAYSQLRAALGLAPLEVEEF